MPTPSKFVETIVKKIIFVVAAVAYSCASLAETKLEGFDLSLAQQQPFPVTSFYENVGDVSQRPVGSLIRKESIAAPAGAVAWRVMYVSERWDGKHVAASGMVVAPRQPAATARPVVAWAHGTTGAARGCAPSLAPNPARELMQRGGADQLVIDVGIPFLSDWIAQGYAVVAPDYAGLGSDAVHRYLVGEDAARDIHNLLRASRAIGEASIGDSTALLGWSQGGQAVLFAGENATSYAPDNKVRSIVALAPAATLLSSATNAIFKSKVPYPVLIGQGYQDAYNLDKKLFTDDGQKLLAASHENCVVTLFGAVAAAGPAVTSNVTDNAGWTNALGRNNAGLERSETPVLVLQGLKDTIVPPESSKAYAERATAVGTDVTIEWVEDAGHRELFAKKADIVARVVAGFEASRK